MSDKTTDTVGNFLGKLGQEIFTLRSQNEKQKATIKSLEDSIISACDLAGKDENGRLCVNAHELAVRCNPNWKLKRIVDNGLDEKDMRYDV